MVKEIQQRSFYFLIPRQESAATDKRPIELQIKGSRVYAKEKTLEISLVSGSFYLKASAETTDIGIGSVNGCPVAHNP